MSRPRRKTKRKSPARKPAPKPSLDLDLVFPEPDATLLQGPGEPCSWHECMRQMAAQTRYYLKHYGHLPPPPPPQEPFRMDE